MRSFRSRAVALEVGGFAVTIAASAVVGDVAVAAKVVLVVAGVTASLCWQAAAKARSQPYSWRCDRCGTGISASDPGTTATFADAHPQYCHPRY